MDCQYNFVYQPSLHQAIGKRCTSKQPDIFARSLHIILDPGDGIASDQAGPRLIDSIQALAEYKLMDMSYLSCKGII